MLKGTFIYFLSLMHSCQQAGEQGPIELCFIISRVCWSTVLLVVSLIWRECVTRFSTFRFFHDSNSSVPVINRLKYFWILFPFRQDIRIKKTLRCASHSSVMKSSQKTPRCASHSAVCIISRSLTLRCASHHGVNNLPNVCFNPKFYKYYFAVMPKDITTKLIL